MKELRTFRSAALVLSLIFSQFAHTEENTVINQHPIVIFETTQGNFEVELFPETAPLACENFLGLVDAKYYEGTTFHRVIKDFMIQGGDPTGTGAGGESIWKKTFCDECTPKVLFNAPGLLAMANRGPNTNGSQFFITTASTPWLNGNHTIFGKVISGYECVQKIESVSTDSNNRPRETQQIVKIRRKKTHAPSTTAS